MKHFYVSVAGLMGSGKTTLTKFLAKTLEFHFFEERVSDNKFLPLYYQDPKQWALHSQLFYLQEKISQLTKIKDLIKTSSVLQDTPIYQDCFTYARAQKELGYLSDEEYKLYMDFFNLLEAQLPKPDLIIQLDAPIALVEERIRLRGRDYEKNITRKYLELLNDLQNDWLSKNSNLNIVKVKTDNRDFDIANNLNYQSEMLKNIKSAISGRI